MRSLLFLLLCLSCTKDSKTDHHLKYGPWPVLENFHKQSWDTEKILAHLGKPNEVIKSKDGSPTWVYYDTITGYQSWAVGVSASDQKITGIAYFPGSTGKTLLVKDLESRWKDRGCIRSKETKLIAGHNYSTENFLECDNGTKVIKYNQYGEVQGISVE